MSKIGSFPLNEDDDEDFTKIQSDQDLYNSVFELLTPIERSLYDIPLANKYYSPRIITHYKYYNESVLPKFESTLKSKCHSIPKTWLQYNDVVYCNPDDVYALMSDESAVLDEDILLPIDRVIGTSGPILVLYGDVKDEKFKQFISNLYESALSGKFRFVWRYVGQNVSQREILNGYGFDLTVKRTDYIVIDDRDINKGGQKVLQKEKSIEDDSDTSFLNQYIPEIKPIKEADVAEFDLKLASFILSTDNHTENYQNLRAVINGLPRFTASIVEKPINQDILKSFDHNAEMGLTNEAISLFINGAALDEKQENVYGIYGKIKEELEHIEHMSELGIDSFNAKEMFGKFALGNVVNNKGAPSSRYLIEAEGSPVIYFNDIENDKEYSRLSNDMSVYLRKYQFGEIPPLKQNIHTIVFAITPSNKQLLQIIVNILTAIRENGIAQRIGFIPIIESEADLVISNNIYHIVQTKGVKKALKYIRKLTEQGNEPIKPLTEKEFASKLILPFLEKFDIKRPAIIVNGIFHHLDADWPYAVTRQTTIDVQYISNLIYTGQIKTADEIAEVFYAGSRSSRNTFAAPEDPNAYTYKRVPPHFLNSITKTDGEFLEYSKVNDTSDHFITFTLGGSFGSKSSLQQLLEILKFVKSNDFNIKVRVIEQSIVSFIGVIRQGLNGSIDNGIAVIEKLIKQNQFAQFEQNPNLAALLNSIGIEDRDFIMVNGRYVKLDYVVNAETITAFVSHEISTRLLVIEPLLKNKDLVPTFKSYFDWFEAVSSLITKVFYPDRNDMTFLTIPRFDFSAADYSNAISFGDKKTSNIHLLLTIDPANEKSQKFLALTESFFDLPFVSVDILIQPNKELVEIPVKRFYLSNIQAKVKFDESGSFSEEEYIGFENIPEANIFALDVDVPPRWIVVPKESRNDLDNILLEQSGPLTASYELENIIIEGNAFTDKTYEPPTGLAVQVQGSDTNVMMMLGYLQLKANPGLWDFSIQKGRSTEVYSLLSIDSLRSKIDEVHESVPVALTSLGGINIFPRVIKNPGFEKQRLITIDEPGLPKEQAVKEKEEKKGGFFSSLLGGNKVDKKHADINIFTIASGHLYERLASIMTASVMANTKHTVKFWLIDNYMSPTFRAFLPYLAEKYGFEYELITYKWPSWILPQREKQRTIWGYKILFLDVLFPQDLDKVIFVDADQIVRTDLKELVDLDLEGAPYGYTPMGESRKEMEGFRFWKEGYWAKYLGDTYKYHISALYVIDLKKFRELAAGDKLRHHYNQLSRDPGSLSNLDQDLPNNLQHQLKIFSLPQDWLWCETWCDDESLKTAKTIDLCNNPLTKEHKLDRARRQIPEWNVYDQEIQELHDEVFGKDEEIKIEEAIQDAEDYARDEL